MIQKTCPIGIFSLRHIENMPPCAIFMPSDDSIKTSYSEVLKTAHGGLYVPKEHVFGLSWYKC